MLDGRDAIVLSHRRQRVGRAGGADEARIERRQILPHAGGVVALGIDRHVDHLHRIGRRRRAACGPAASVASVIGQTAAQLVKPNASSTTLPR